MEWYGLISKQTQAQVADGHLTQIATVHLLPSSSIELDLTVKSQLFMQHNICGRLLWVVELLALLLHLLNFGMLTTIIIRHSQILLLLEDGASLTSSNMQEIPLYVGLE